VNRFFADAHDFAGARRTIPSIRGLPKVLSAYPGHSTEMFGLARRGSGRRLMKTLQTNSDRPPMRTPPTTRLCLQDSHCFESDARIVAVRENYVAFDQSCFFPGGGGQSADEGSVRLASGEALKIVSVQAEFRKRDDLLRTLEAKPPVSQGQVRVAEIQGFDAQACGGTHVNATSEVGRFSIFRTNLD
jgi:hypothetical protein